MNTQEFFEQCNQSMKAGTLLTHSEQMNAFGGDVESAMSDCEKLKSDEEYANKPEVRTDGTMTNSADDFSDNFDDSFKEGNVAVDSNFADDFDDDFSDTFIGQELAAVEVDEAECLEDLTIHSVQMHVQTLQKDNTIETEIKQFLIKHSSFSDAGTDLVKLWNQIYNDNLFAVDDIIEKYIKVRYGVWFTDVQVLQEVLALGTDFLHQLKFDYRMCSLSDVRFIRECWCEPWYDPGIINEFALDVNFVPLLIALMKNGKIDVDIMMRYRENQEVLLCCLRLLNSDRFILGEFEKAVNDMCCKQYTESVLSGEKNRMKVIEHREDFNDIKVKIRALEGDGKIIDWDLVEKYKDAYYLSDIILASSDGRFNAEFVDKYLLKPLGKFSFISAMYAENAVNVEIAPSNFMYAKICTDAGNLGLEIHRFEAYKGMRGLTCLVCSRYAGNLPETDYRKFMAVLSLDKTLNLIVSINKSEQLIESYSAFWLDQLLKHLGLSLLIGRNIGDDILFVKFVGNKRRKYYLQIDDFVINQEKFLGLISGSISCGILDKEKGIVLSNVSLNSNYHFSCKAKSSLTEWANNGLDKNLQVQYGDGNFIMHTNFWKALQSANERAKMQQSRGMKLNRSVLNFIKMDMGEYYNYDKMFNYVAGRQEFLGIFMSENAFALLKLFSNAYVYHTVSQVMFMFLYVVLLKFSATKLELYSEGFTSLDPNKTVLIADGLGINNTVINYRTVSDSIDNLIEVAQKSQKVILRVSEKTINIQVFK